MQASYLTLYHAVQSLERAEKSLRRAQRQLDRASYQTFGKWDVDWWLARYDARVYRAKKRRDALAAKVEALCLELV
jgi:hypothetical protein